MTGPLFLGLDLSTQQLKAVVIDDDCNVAYSDAINFGRDLPEFGTSDGFLTEGDSAWSPVGLWLEAVDRLLTRLASNSSIVSRIAAISGTAQQHGTVYWSKRGDDALGTMYRDKSIRENLQNGFATDRCPIWRDSSTGEFVDKFDRLIPDLNRISGSKAYHRFSGPQIAKIRAHQRTVYEETTRISLISSFLPSLFLGRVAPIDTTDACGTNLLDIQSGDWSDACLDVVVDANEDDREDLRKKLGGKPVPAQTKLGTVSSYIAKRFGFPEECSVVAFTGDNLSSMADLNVVEGDVVLSLGSSDTAIFVTREFIPLERGHLFIHPTAIGQYITLICYKNGSLTRERIRKNLGLTWPQMEEMLRETPAGNNGCIGIYFDMAEIEPRVSAGDWRWDAEGNPVQHFSPEVEARAALEGQCLHLRANCPETISRVIVTGGASANASIRQMLADVFGRPVHTAAVADSAAQGGAKRAKYMHDSPSVSYHEHFKSSLTLEANPNRDNVEVYKNLLKVYRERERSLVENAGHV